MKKSKLNKCKQIKTNVYDCLIPIIFVLAMIIPFIVATSQRYIVQYGDDVVMLTWAKDHHIWDIFTSKEGTGYRPIMNAFYIIGYSLWGSQALYYYLMSGALFAGGMVFLYLIGKTLYSRIAGLIAVILFLSLDASFILVSKINYIVSTGEIFFITSAIYFSINYFKTNNNKSKWLAITLSILAFLTKEPSIIIIPLVNLAYLYYNNQLNKKIILVNLIPFIYLIIEVLFIAPDIANGNVGFIQRIIDNSKAYYDLETNTQFKNSILLGIVILSSAYIYSYRDIKTAIGVSVMWFIAGIVPMIMTSQPVQPTYLPEPNLGLVLLTGFVVAESFKKYNLVTGAIVVGVVIQSVVIPFQISNMISYNRMISDNQNTFYDTVRNLNVIPYGQVKTYYIPKEIREKYGGYQLDEEMFRKYVCLVDGCYGYPITTNYTEASYVILPSSSDIQIFQKEHPSEMAQLVKKVQYGNEYGIILKKV